MTIFWTKEKKLNLLDTGIRCLVNWLHLHAAALRLINNSSHLKFEASVEIKHINFGTNKNTHSFFELKNKYF